MSTIFLNNFLIIKGGEPDFSTVAKMVLNDWLRGKIPYYTAPPEDTENQSDETKGK